MDNKLKEKLSKLYELVKRGVKGEKANAEKILNALLKKHNLSISDIDSDLKKDRYYKYTSKMSNDIISQIVFNVVDTEKVYENKSLKFITVKATDYENVQILEMIDFHIDNFNKERKIFLKDFTSAYIHKHNLFRSSEPKEENSTPLTTKEKQDIWRMSNIMNCMSNNSYVKKIEP